MTGVTSFRTTQIPWSVTALNLGCAVQYMMPDQLSDAVEQVPERLLPELERVFPAPGCRFKGDQCRLPRIQSGIDYAARMVNGRQTWVERFGGTSDARRRGAVADALWQSVLGKKPDMDKAVNLGFSVFSAASFADFIGYHGTGREVVQAALRAFGRRINEEISQGLFPPPLRYADNKVLFDRLDDIAAEIQRQFPAGTPFSISAVLAHELRWKIEMAKIARWEGRSRKDATAEVVNSLARTLRDYNSPISIALSRSTASSGRKGLVVARALEKAASAFPK